MDQDQAPTGKESTCGMYVVGLIDLLNQGRQLDEWSSLPTTDAEESDFKGALKRTVEVVHSIREAFKGFAESYTRRELETHSLHATVTDEQKAEYQRLTDFQLGRQSFSDTVVLYSSLAIAGGDTTVFGLHGMLLASASVLLLGLAEAVPLRGGIEVGMAIDRFPDEIYGPVLRRAYLLEQNVAQYPRVVVGPEAIAYLELCRRVPPGNAATELNRDMAKKCLSLVARDQDGVYFVDFLSNSVHGLLADKADYRGRRMQGHAFAKREHERFVEAGDHKLALRYARLRQYYESRM